MNTNYNNFYGRLVSEGRISEKVGQLLQSLSAKSTDSSAEGNFSSIYNEALSRSDSVSSPTSNMNYSAGGYTIPTDYEAIFQQAASTYNVPANLLKAVAKAESNFQPNIVSSSGAQGIMQLMPGTAAALGVADPLDPSQNIMGGAKYLSQMITRFNGNIELALAGYNAGPASVEKYGGVPPFTETQNYVKKVLQYMGQGIELPQNYNNYTTGPLGYSSVGGGSTISKDAALAQILLGNGALSGRSNSYGQESGLSDSALLQLRNSLSTSSSDLTEDTNFLLPSY